MSTLHIAAMLLCLAAALSYINARFLKLPMTIGLMILSLLLSLVLLGGSALGVPVSILAQNIIGGLDFSYILLEAMLGLLLFAGALHVNLDDLLDQGLAIAIFATLGVLASTFLVGGAVYLLAGWLDLPLRFIDCLLFGALISPTDPIAVLGIMNTTATPRSLKTLITGESLFNDGFGVVIFLVILELSQGGHFEAGHVGMLLLEEVLGGLLFGLAAGYLSYLLLRSINNYQVEIMITLALVMGGYTLAHELHFSGPLAMVAAGLLVGNRGRNLAMSTITREHLDTFWELVDEILNALLFVLIGLEVLILTFDSTYFLAGTAAVAIALTARLISVGAPMTILRRTRAMPDMVVRVMTWGGLRGGISVALALALPQSASRDIILTMTYVVVAFSIIVQGLSFAPLVRKASS